MKKSNFQASQDNGDLLPVCVAIRIAEGQFLVNSILYRKS